MPKRGSPNVLSPRCRRPKPENSRVDTEALYAWLDDHRAAWSGWPTFVAYDRAEIEARAIRLRRHGCLIAGRAEELVRWADELIGRIRNRTRSDYYGALRRANELEDREVRRRRED